MYGFGMPIIKNKVCLWWVRNCPKYIYSLTDTKISLPAGSSVTWALEIEYWVRGYKGRDSIGGWFPTRQLPEPKSVVVAIATHNNKCIINTISLQFISLTI